MTSHGSLNYKFAGKPFEHIPVQTQDYLEYNFLTKLNCIFNKNKLRFSSIFSITVTLETQ